MWKSSSPFSRWFPLLSPLNSSIVFNRNFLLNILRETLELLNNVIVLLKMIVHTNNTGYNFEVPVYFY